MVRVRRASCSRIDWKHMTYVHILEMVDEYLDRLMQARQLLLTLDPQRGGSEPVARSRGMHAPLEQAATARKRTQPKPRKLPKSQGSSARTPETSDGGEVHAKRAVFFKAWGRAWF